MPQTFNNNKEWRQYLLASIKDINDALTEVKIDVATIKAALKAKTLQWSLIGGAIPTLTIVILWVTGVLK